MSLALGESPEKLGRRSGKAVKERGERGVRTRFDKWQKWHDCVRNTRGRAVLVFVLKGPSCG